MKYIKILNILIIVMLLSTIMVDNVKAASDYYRVNVEFEMIDTFVNYMGHPEIFYPNYVDINGNRRISNYDASNVLNFSVNHNINTVRIGHRNGYLIWCEVMMAVSKFTTTNATFRIYRDDNTLVAFGSGLGTHTLNLPCPSITPPTPINSSHALNFTLAAAMAMPTMTIGVVDDIMLIVGKYIKCGIAKFAIRAALLKYAAKGVAVTIAITGISYLFAEFADEIYYSIFASIPEINPGDDVFHESEIHQVMDIINTHFPVSHAVAYAIEQSIWQHVDAYGMILISEVMTIVRQKQEEIVIDIYKEAPGFFPPEIVVNKEQVPEVMELIDEYFPVEFPIRNIIEQEIYRNIYDDKYSEIPFSAILEIIEQEQNLYIPEVPTKTVEEQYEYIDRLIDKVIYEDVFIPISATPFIFEGIPVTPIIPRTPKRPKEKIHTFPFYSIFVDPLAGVIGITLAHLFTAMMIIGAIISIGAAWGSIGAIFAGFIGTITTAYFGLTSWLIPVFLIIMLIIYANIRIKTGVGKE